MEKNVLCVKNRDARQQYLAQMLLEDGCQVTLCEEKCRELGEYELVLLPVVTAKLDLKQMICQLQKGQRVFGGNLPEFFQDACMEKGVSCCNLLEYLTQRDIQTKNSGVNVRYRGKHRFFKGFNEFIKEKTRRCDNDFEKIERHVFF